MYLSSAASEVVASALQKIASRSLTSSSAASQKKQHIIILGGGIAGLSTARYLLGHTQQHRSVKITLIDRNIVDTNNNTLPSSTYEEQQTEYPHFSTPSRRNGNVLCPSLTIPWTTRSLFNEAIKPAINRYLRSIRIKLIDQQ
eukprot:scaffold23170_cov176-Skeletonema_dohrnii-CCMP3373.AAC.3